VVVGGVGGDADGLQLHNSVQSGQTLLAHMQGLADGAGQLVHELDLLLTSLVARRVGDLADMERDFSAGEMQAYAEREGSVEELLKQLSALGQTVRHTLAPMHLTHHEELNRLLSGRGFMDSLANTLFGLSLTTAPGASGLREHVCVSVAALLIRSRSKPLLQSVFSKWPCLTMTHSEISVAVAPRRPVSVTDLTQTNTQPGSQRAPYSLDFGSSASASASASTRSPTKTAAGGVARTATDDLSVGAAREEQKIDVKYVTEPAADMDVAGCCDFDSPKSLRLLGVTLPQLRDAKVSYVTCITIIDTIILHIHTNDAYYYDI
jgi:hypothetical protein